jgi:type IV fimbrial biogenesis protein FimT
MNHALLTGVTRGGRRAQLCCYFGKAHAAGIWVKGFTLIELMITIAIAAILAGLAAPAFQGVIANNRLKSHSSAIYSALLLARSEAIKRNTSVALCKSIDGAACVSTGGWQQGWIVFHDANGDGVHQVAETIVQRATGLSGDFSVDSTVSGSSTAVHQVSFASSGSIVQPLALTFSICNRAGAGPARIIGLLITGRARMESTTVSTCA